jgi:transketolase
LNSNAQNPKGIKRPSTLVFSRQGMKNMDTTSIEGTLKGAYPVVECANPDVILIGTGSELEMAVAAGEKLTAEGKKVRVVSMPCWELYEEQPQSYKDSVLTPGVPKVSVEAGSTFGWQKYVGEKGVCIGVDDFGASAPAPILYEKYGITVDAVVNAAKSIC